MTIKIFTISVFLLFQIPMGAHATLIAHRGVHQTYYREGLTNETCTAARILKPEHDFLENTVESIEEAFGYFANVVEVDIHPTTEKDGPDELVVFHDWTVDCRTEARCENGCECNSSNECETNKQTLSYLQSLDIGYGYTFDQGETFPFRGRYVGKMPSFESVLELLLKHPQKKILVNVKGNKNRTVDAFIRLIKNYDLDVRKRLYYPYRYGRSAELSELGVLDEIIQGDKECLYEYLKVGWLGIFPKVCWNKKIMIPVRETLERMIGGVGRHVKFTSILWGWPERFIELAHKNGTEIFASQVDSVEEYEELKDLKLDGFMTNKIEIVGPHSRKK